VKKFGTDYAIGSITNAVINTPRSDGGGVNQWRYTFYGWNGAAWVSMAYVDDANGVSSFTDVSDFAAEKIKITVSVLAGAITITDADTISLTTDIDSPLSVILPGEGNSYTFTSGTLDLYLSATGGTYYDSDYKHGGKRHTPDGSVKYPYFHPADVLALGGFGANDGIVVTDNEHYQCDTLLITDNGVVLQSALGYTPTFNYVVGVSGYRDKLENTNNDDTAYVGVDGSDSTGDGTYLNPYATHQYALDNAGARTNINTIDSGIYNEALTVNSSVTLEPIYGETPTITESSTQVILFDAINFKISGYTIDGLGAAFYGIKDTGALASYSGTIKNCSIIRCSQFIQIQATNYSGSIENNRISQGIDLGSNFNGVSLSNSVSSGSVSNNIITGMTGDNSTALNCFSTSQSTKFKNNLIFDCSANGAIIGGGPTSFTSEVKNNTVYNCGTVGFRLLTTSPGVTYTWANNVIWGNTEYDIQKSGQDSTITYSNFETNDSVTVGTGCTNDTPELCKETRPYKLGVSALSPGYRSGLSSEDMGVNTSIIEYSANDIKLNGIIFDGLGDATKAFSSIAGAVPTGAKKTNITILGLIGIAIDNNAEGVSELCELLDTYIYDVGQGAVYRGDGNTINRNVISRAYKVGLYIEGIANTIRNCTIDNNEYGIYLTSLAFSTMRNIIFSQSSVYAIYSAPPSYTYNCCINGQYNEDVIVDDSNITDTPLFLSTIDGREDYRLKAIENGFKIESPCKGAGDDGKDMGAYDIDYSTLSETWDKFTCIYNPRQCKFGYKRKGGIAFEDANGVSSSWSKSHRLALSMDWSGIAGNEQRLALQHISELEPSRELGLTEDQTVIRISLLPEQKLQNGTGTVSGDIITDNGNTFRVNQWKGFHLTIVSTENTGAVIDASAKTLTDSGASWTVDQWAGYYVPINGYYYLIVSNTATALTLSDLDDTLINKASFSYEIVKSYKIKTNDKASYTLVDYDSELTDGSYRYYIDFVEMRILPSDFEYNQNQYDITKELTKVGYSLSFEEA
jgi:parallel beta-helix repeat protein